MAPIFFFRGLNTYGDDLMHLGSYTLGKMYGPIRESLKERDIKIYAVKRMNSGSFEEIVENAKNSLIQKKSWKKTKKVHFLGHSMGALVARALVRDHEIAKKVLSITSYGTPHMGAPIAEKVLALDNKKAAALKYFGWDVTKKFHMIEHLTPERMTEFAKEYPDQYDVHYASAICQLPRKELCLPIQAISRISGCKAPSDGVVSVDSQTHGEVLGEFDLDHISALGFYPHFSAQTREKRRVEFERLLDHFQDFWNRW